MSRRDHRKFLVSGLTLGTWMLVDDHAYDKREGTNPRIHVPISCEDSQNHLAVQMHKNSLEHGSL